MFETEIDKLRRAILPKKRIAFVSGNFNVLHPGHLRLLKFAAENGDALVVGVNSDGTPGATVPAQMRFEGVCSLTMVDHAVLLDGPPHEFIAQLKPDIVIKGKEFHHRINPEQTIVDSYGGKLIFSSGEVGLSSYDFTYDYYFGENVNINKPSEFLKRHDFDLVDLKVIIDKIIGIRTLVIGDLITDTYVECEPLGMSREDPTLVVRPLTENSFVGGAGIVAAHARGLGAEVELLTIGGNDDRVGFVRSELEKFGVENEILIDATRPTTNKVRYRAAGKTLLRLNRLRQHAIDDDLIYEMVGRVEALLPRTDLILFSDFNYGCLPQSLVDSIVSRALKSGIMLAADSQASSQYSDISRFRNMTLITPTEHEARLAMRDFDSGLVVLSERLAECSRARNVLVTLGDEGLLIHAPENSSFPTDRLPAFNAMPKDVAGAGDCLFTCTSLALKSGADIWRSTYLGSLAAAHQVSQVGNLPIKAKDLIAELDYPLD